MKLQVFLLAILCLQYARCQHSALCRSTTTAGAEFEVIFKLNVATTPWISGLAARGTSDAPHYLTHFSDATCSTTTNTNDIFTLDFDFDTGAATLACGASLNGGTVYDFAISPIGTDIVYLFTCDSANLDVEMDVTVANFGTGHLMDTTQMSYDHSVAFDVVLPGAAGTSIDTATVGEPIVFQLTYDRGLVPSAETSLHVVSLKASDTADFTGRVVNIITAGCNNNAAGTVSKCFGLFTEISDTAGVVILRTVAKPCSRAFRFDGDPLGSKEVYFQLTYELCYGDPATCNTCSTRRKRSIEHHDVHKVDATLLVKDKPTRESTECKNMVLYWAPHVLLLLLILVESVVIAIVLRKKVKLQ